MIFIDLLCTLFSHAMRKRRIVKSCPKPITEKPPNNTINSKRDCLERKQIEFNQQLMKDGYVEKVFVNGNHGGDYIEFHFFNNQDRYVTKDKCTKAVLRECMYDGKLVYEEWAMMSNKW